MMEMLLWSSAAFWLILFTVAMVLWRYRFVLSSVAQGSAEADSEWPLVSILVPARNEEHRILREAIGSLLRQDYPRLEVIVVNDRSTDRTLDILREMARSDSRMRVLDGEEPPPGWRGKPFALQQALAIARGEWILAVDADIVAHPAAVRTALSLARERQLDAVSLLPKFEYVSFWDRVVEPQALNLLRLGMLIAAWRERKGGLRPSEGGRRWRSFHPLALLSAYVGDPAFTIGAFTLIRRSALEEIGGYAAIRGEVLDETILGIRLKQRGYRVLAVEGAPLVRTPARATLAEIWEAYSRSICSAVGRRWPIALIGGSMLLWLTVFPPLALLGTLVSAGDHAASLALPAAMAYLAMTGLTLRLSWADRLTPLSAGLAFLGYAVFAAIAFAVPWRLWSGAGVMWRGRCVYGERRATSHNA
ncbi:MAG: glycosyltransferase family 2 protein [Blastocatellia bacterium]|nr:glycosyltransferase family 2 protein [Blastocatellia bacterium]MCS7158556.1 glycosyltransferase family 2 protein [Blastocatellia bacterium]MDW8169319.1 glycosyltransferase family 2 protein [Acidobacteriota bacterium]MDW8257752.1 glycosyltransferase family 2 protein [Acidobacteriota bacterium]